MSASLSPIGPPTDTPSAVGGRDAAAPGPPSDRAAFAEWLFYDGSCRLCTRSIRRWRRILARRSIGATPLQTPWVERIVGSSWDEMKLLTRDDCLLGGIDAALHIARRVAWLRPFALLARLPGMHGFMDRTYRWVAARRYCVAGRCELDPPGA